MVGLSAVECTEVTGGANVSPAVRHARSSKWLCLSQSEKHFSGTAVQGVVRRRLQSLFCGSVNYRHAEPEEHTTVTPGSSNQR